MNLEELRERLDLLDSEFIKLLNARMELALRTRKLKAGPADAAREKEVLEKARKSSVGLARPEFVERLFSEIIAESRKMQEANPVLFGFQGEHGAYGEMAAGSFSRSAVPISCREFADVFSAVEKGQLDFGMVPVENSLEGAVTQVNDLLVDTPLQAVGEVYVPVHHCLLALPETDYRDIRVVYSHPQALAQCRGFISRNRLEPRPFYDTAGAAMMLSNDRPEAAAAIASRLCAKLYGLEVLKENIEDHESNTTRFLVLSRERAGTNGNKCSIIFSTSHRAGALFSVLKVFSDAGINLTRIESRPVRNEPKKFAFLLDFQGNDADPKVASALQKVKADATMFKMLGCYGEAKAVVG
jgi:prephenate dehydratase/chorismate mutase/prephenate dehydratase